MKKEKIDLIEIIYEADCKTCYHEPVCPMLQPPYWLIDTQKDGCNLYKKRKKKVFKTIDFYIQKMLESFLKV